MNYVNTSKSVEKEVDETNYGCNFNSNDNSVKLLDMLNILNLYHYKILLYWLVPY